MIIKKILLLLKKETINVSIVKKISFERKAQRNELNIDEYYYPIMFIIIEWLPRKDSPSRMIENTNDFVTFLIR